MRFVHDDWKAKEAAASNDPAIGLTGHSAEGFARVVAIVDAAMVPVPLLDGAALSRAYVAAIAAAIRDGTERPHTTLADQCTACVIYERHAMYSAYVRGLYVGTYDDAEQARAAVRRRMVAA